MTKSELKAETTYLCNHTELFAEQMLRLIQSLTPSQADCIFKALLDKIGTPATGLQQAKEGNDEWLTAKEVGNRLGRSAEWVKLHAYKLPEHCKMRKGGKRTMFFNFPQVRNQLEQIKQQ